jgi:outer membrane autotransporter protein
MGEYVRSKVDFNHSSTEATFEGGSVGAYATYLNGNYFADLLVKADLLNLAFDNYVLGSRDADVTSLGGRLDLGYRFNLPGTWFAEPLATVEYVSTDFSNLSYPGAVVSFDDQDSPRGRLGLRVGTPWTLFGYRAEWSVIGSVWHRFTEENSVTLTSSGSAFSFADREADKTYGEVGAMLNLFAADGRTSAFAKTDVRFGENLLGTSIKAGLRYQW